MSLSRIRLLASVSALTLITTVTGCGGGGSGDPSAASDSSGAQTLTVFAAASLTDVYGEINDAFEAKHPGVTVRMTNGGSQDLVTQIEQGAPADVLATADEKTMASAKKSSLLSGEPQIFATNELTIAVQPGNPRGISSLKDLADPGTTVVRCAAEVPCGGVTDAILADTGITLAPASEENSVTDVLGKVTSGEADAGLVYTTDVVRSGGKTEPVAIPEAAAHRTNYPIVVTREAHDPDLAQEYVDVVRSEAGRAALKKAGFGAP